MKHYRLLLAAMPLALMAPALVHAEATSTDEGAKSGAEAPAKKKEEFSTGVARARDVLDMSISTSSLDQDEIQKLSARSLGEVLRNIPGVRAENAIGDGNENITIRGLPMASTGAKFLQLQEDGLPVLEFGDIGFAGADAFLRTDLTVSQIQAIRGGSASTFASNSPAGVINIISKTGEHEGGSVQLSSGLDYDSKRIDLDYGGKLSDTINYNIGGFYRAGEGPRAAGYTAFKGGQIKFNVTKKFDGGYFRLYGKYLNDRVPSYLHMPMQVTGTDSNPTYSNVPGFDAKSDTLLSRYFQSITSLNDNDQTETHSVKDGLHTIQKAIGAETKFDVAGWTITDHFRYSWMSGTYFAAYPALLGSTSDIVAGINRSYAQSFLVPPNLSNAVFTYANGPNAGAVYNGLIAGMTPQDVTIHSLDNMTNDLRASRVFNVGGGELTTTAGYYRSRQVIDATQRYESVFMAVQGGGNAPLLNLTSSSGANTQNGVFAYDGALFTPTLGPKRVDVVYTTNAAFGSLNYHVGKLVLGASLRYDFGTARGSIINGVPNAFAPEQSYDVNGDGVISDAETRVGLLSAGTESPVHYSYHYLSYSAGVNYRVSEPLAIFARYSRGGRTNSDRLLFTAIGTDPTTGGLLNRSALVDYVRQAEVGMKYRQGDLALNLTGFWAKNLEHNAFFGPIVNREYRAVGLEFEGSYRMGPFSLGAGATYTDAKIVKDTLDATWFQPLTSVQGNTPLGQPKWMFELTPQFESGRFAIGTNVYGVTDRYALDVNTLKMPGYITVNPFVQYRPIDRVLLSLNVNNLFDVTGISAADDSNSLGNGIVQTQTILGRTVSASLRFDF